MAVVRQFSLVLALNRNLRLYDDTEQAVLAEFDAKLENLEAEKVYEQVRRRVARSIFVQVLKYDKPELMEAIDSLE